MWIIFRPIDLFRSGQVFPKGKVMNKRLLNIILYIERFEILYSLQLAFRSNRSTSHALTHLVNKIVTEIDQNKIFIGVFSDLSKAFYTLNHDIHFFDASKLWYT